MNISNYIIIEPFSDCIDFDNTSCTWTSNKTLSTVARLHCFDSFSSLGILLQQILSISIGNVHTLA